MKENNTTYRTILKSTSLVGGSQMISIFFKAIRKKILALLIGASGIGLFGLYTSIINLVMSFSNLGIATSCVKEIAEYRAKNDDLNKIVKITILLFIITGILGSLITVFFSEKISIFTTGNTSETRLIKYLSFVVLLNTLSLGLGSIIQGMRKIKKLATVTIWSSISSLVVSTIIVYFLRERGIALSIIIVAVINIIVYYNQFKTLRFSNVRISLKELISNSSDMIKLGISFMGAGIATSLSAYLINVYLNRNYGVEFVGYYHAAIGISSLYVGMVLSAMGKDFYPRLAMTIKDNEKTIKTINEQVEVGMLISISGLLLTFIFAPTVITIFYSSDFLISYKILRWVVLGVFIRVISWPLGYYLIANGDGRLYFITELTFNTLNIFLIILFTKAFGIIGLGIAFSIQYIIYLAVMKRLIKAKCGYYWSPKVKYLTILFSFVLVLYLLLWLLVNNIWGTILMSMIFVVITIYSIKNVLLLLEIDSMNKFKLSIVRFIGKIKK